MHWEAGALERGFVPCADTWKWILTVCEQGCAGGGWLARVLNILAVFKKACATIISKTGRNPKKTKT